MAPSSGSSSQLFLWCLLVILGLLLPAVAPGSEARNATDFVNATHLFVGEDVQILAPRIDPERIVFLTFRVEFAPLAILFPFQPFAESQVRRPSATGVLGIFALCHPNDPILTSCLRPGISYINSETGEEVLIGMPPFTPKNVSVQKDNPTTITLSWTPVQGAEIDHYECYIFWNTNLMARADKPLSSPRVLDTLYRNITNIPSNPFTITDLPAFSWISVTLVAVHVEGTYGSVTENIQMPPASIEGEKPALFAQQDIPPIPSTVTLVSFPTTTYKDVAAFAEVEITNLASNRTSFQRTEMIEIFFQGLNVVGGRIFNLEPFTPYRLRLRFLGNLTRTTTQWSEPAFVVSPEDLQPPLAFEESPINTDSMRFVNVTWAEQPRNAANITIRLRVFDGEGNLVDVRECSDCRYQLFDANRVRSGEFKFLSGTAINPVGNSSSSGVFVLRLQGEALAAQQEKKDNTLTIVLATVLPIVLALIIATFILYRKWKTRYVYQMLQFPEADEWELPRQKVVVDYSHELGHGAFGIVFLGHLLMDLEELPMGALAAVKTVRKEANDERKMELIEEAGRMKRLGHHAHPNVIQLYGACLQAQPLLIVMEYAPYGTLRSYVLAEDPPDEELVRFAVHVARGMAFLSERDFVHRDLAARNCMVGLNRVVKVADFGLARDVHYLHYYRKTGAVVLPVRWMAPECLVEGKFNSETDVWSFGVVLWEIFSGARLPYEEIGNDQVLEHVIRGLRLVPPPKTPKVIAHLMVACFALQRPTFQDLSAVLETYYEQSCEVCAQISDEEEEGETAAAYMADGASQLNEGGTQSDEGVAEISPAVARSGASNLLHPPPSQVQQQHQQEQQPQKQKHHLIIDLGGDNALDGGGSGGGGEGGACARRGSARGRKVDGEKKVHLQDGADNNHAQETSV